MCQLLLPRAVLWGMQKHYCGDMLKLVPIQPHFAIKKMSLLLLLLIGLIHLCPALYYSFPVSSAA